jgi:hypothetical protein
MNNMKYLKVFESFFEGSQDENNIECGYYKLSRIFGITFDEVKDLFRELLDEYLFLDFEIKTHITRKEFSVLLHDTRPYTGIKNVSDVEITDSFIQELNGRLSEYNLSISYLKVHNIDRLIRFVIYLEEDLKDLVEIE